ncbi:MAG: serine/threonine-protein kinase [Gammaproteobacteria bacterium]|nr:serine/threonine-protein kinase [Gammaproteobacteria bacterium]
MSDRRLLESVADAVAAGEAVDWFDVELAAAKGRDADLLEQLKIVSAIGAKRRPLARSAPTCWNRILETGVAVVLAIAVARLAVVVVSVSAPACTTDWTFVLNALLFGAGGVVLLVGGARDRRLPLLGGLFLAISSAFVTVLMPSVGACFDGGLAAALRPFQPEAFLALMLWRFVQRFPVDTQRPTLSRISRALVDASFGAGAVLFTISAIGDLGWTIPAWSTAAFELLDRDDPYSAYWPLLLAIAAPAVPFLLWKARLEAHEERRRVMFFVGALAVGLTPFVLVVVASPFVPVLWDAAVQERVGVVLYAALASVVPITTYSVAVDRVMDLKFVIRTTAKYALARFAVWALSLGPIAYVGFDIYANQQLTIAEYFERSRPIGPLALSAVGMITLVARQQLLLAVDRWFLAEPSAQSHTLDRLEQQLRKSDSLRGVTRALAAELGRALHAPTVNVLLVNDDGTELVPVEGSTGAIRRESTLVEVLHSTRGDVPLDAHALGGLARLIPPVERDWLHASGARLLCPLVGSTAMLLGFVAIGEAKNGLPYSARHFPVVAAACRRAATQIENRRLRDRTAHKPYQSGNRSDQGLDWRDEPAVYCPACSLVWSPETPRCSCGTATTVAALPLFVHEKFRLERLVGAGGMGVVYLAVDMVLDRTVAIKTLPSLRSESAERLHREARTMAKVLHPNLALIYGVEEWRGVPMLVVEYLDGGTLRDCIRRGPVSYASAIDLGLVLADVLARVHEAGVLHRDVKPSNIGYTSDGRPKLLDFGLALLDRGAQSPRPIGEPLSDAVREALSRSTDPGSTVTVADRLVGTPLYLAPEALAGVTPQPSFDLWGLGLVLYEALAGRHPFAAEDSAKVLAAVERADVPDIRDYRPTCPLGLAAFLRAALSPKVSRRPATADAMRRGLHRLRGTIPQHAH